jgi:hypothetical protein
MTEQPDRERILTLRARASMFRRAAGYMSLRAAKDQIESYATELEQEADTLERGIRAAAVTRADAVRQSPTGPEALAEMKREATGDPPLEKGETSPDAVKELFKSRAERLRELAASLSADDKALLLTIATEYDELVNALAQSRSAET